MGNPLYSFYVPLWRGQAATADGDVALARSCVDEVRAMGELSGSLNAPMLATVFEFMTSLRAGEYDRMVADMDAFLASNEELAKYISSIGGPAMAYASAGHIDRARVWLDRAAAIGLDATPWDAEWLSAITALVAASCKARHPLLAEAVARLEPYAHRFAFEGIGAGLYGSCARFVAMGCSALGRHDDAVRYAEQALVATRGAGAMLVADAERTLADCLDARGDVDPAAAHHATADAIFAAAGLVEFVRGASTSRPATTSTPARAVDDERADNELRRDGDVWHLAFGGETAIVKHSKGVADLAVLLAAPGREIHVSELEQVPRELLGGRGGEALDRRAISAYKERLGELAEELDDAEAAHDLARAEKLRVEYDALVDQLSGSLGLGGRARGAGPDPVERLRKAVSARVRDAIRRIEGVHPALSRHLANSVRTGVYCSYRPEQAVVWHCQARSGASGA
jgi:tetratricopeptide (TPR) repeat protein